MIRRPPRATLTATLVPYTALCRSVLPVILAPGRQARAPHGRRARPRRPLRRRAGRQGRPLPRPPPRRASGEARSEEHTSELQSLMRISYAVFCLKKKKTHNTTTIIIHKTIASQYLIYATITH